MISTSIGALTESIFNPSCSRIAVNKPGAALGLAGTRASSVVHRHSKSHLPVKFVWSTTGLSIKKFSSLTSSAIGMFLAVIVMWPPLRWLLSDCSELGSSLLCFNLGPPLATLSVATLWLKAIREQLPHHAFYLLQVWLSWYIRNASYVELF